MKRVRTDIKRVASKNCSAIIGIRQNTFKTLKKYDDKLANAEALHSFIKREEDTEEKFLDETHVLTSPKFRLK